MSYLFNLLELLELFLPWTVLDNSVLVQYYKLRIGLMTIGLSMKQEQLNLS